MTLYKVVGVSVSGAPNIVAYGQGRPYGDGKVGAWLAFAHPHKLSPFASCAGCYCLCLPAFPALPAAGAHLCRGQGPAEPPVHLFRLGQERPGLGPRLRPRHLHHAHCVSERRHELLLLLLPRRMLSRWHAVHVCIAASSHDCTLTLAPALPPCSPSNPAVWNMGAYKNGTLWVDVSAPSASGGKRECRGGSGNGRGCCCHSCRGTLTGASKSNHILHMHHSSPLAAAITAYQVVGYPQGAAKGGEPIVAVGPGVRSQFYVSLRGLGVACVLARQRGTRLIAGGSTAFPLLCLHASRTPSRAAPPGVLHVCARHHLPDDCAGPQRGGLGRGQLAAV